MKIFAWNIFFTNILPEKIPDLDIDILPISKNGLYIMWWLEEWQTLSDIIFLLTQTFWELSFRDISTEDDEDILEILTEDLESWIYECVSFDWPELVFEDIVERFSEVDAVICVREAELSKRYQNRVIRVDFLY